MKIQPDHWIDTAIREPLPGGSPMGNRVFLVIHFTSGATAKSSINFWRTKDAKGASAHFVIDRDGSIYQCRPCDRTAGHAGESRWKCPKTGKIFTGLNSCSIGIELANAGDDWKLAGKYTKLPPVVARHKNGGPETKWEAYPEPQIAACLALSSILCKRYNLDDIVGHEDVAPKRKNDPGPAFPMNRLRQHCGFQIR